MKRSGPLKPGKPLRSTKGLKRTLWSRKGTRSSAQLHKAREFVKSRSRGWCEASTPGCPPGRHPGEHAHHVRLRAQGGADDEQNLLWVCALGHRWIHDHPAESYERRWLERTSGPRSIP